MKSWKFYKDKINEAIEEEFGGEERVVETVDENKTKLDRFKDTLAFIRSVLPEFINQEIFNFLYSNVNKLPFNNDNFSFDGFIGQGGESTVYLLSSQSKNFNSYVIKVYKKDKHYKELNIHELALKRKTEYQLVKDFFDSVEDLIPNEYFVIAEDPRSGNKPALVSIQEFQGQNMVDLFSLSDQEIISLCNQNKFFFLQLKSFVEQLEIFYKNQNKMLELVGPKNLSVVYQDDDYRLVLIDPHHLLDPDSISDQERELLIISQERLERLKKLIDQLKI